MIIESVDLRNHWIFFFFFFHLRLHTLGLFNKFNVGKMQDEIGCSSPHNLRGGIMSNEEGNSSSSSRPWKQARTSVNVEEDGQAMSRSTAIIDSLKRLQKDLVTNGENASAAILGICKLSRDQSL